MGTGFALALACLPLSAFADESGQLVPRDQCEPLYTVQKRGCVAEHVLRCETEDGVIFRNEFIEDGELTDVEFSDHDFEYVDSWSATGEQFILGMVENRDPFSLSNLLETGQDAFDQTALVDMPFVAPRNVELVGTSRMTGDVLWIDGSEIERIALEATLDFSTMLWEIEGDFYLDRATNTLFDGETRMNLDGFVEDLPGAPVRILREGDRGFMLDITLFGCGQAS